jgi:cytoskeletal protein CcmA (bactofilin family)
MRKKDTRSRELSGFLDNGTSFSGDLHFEGTLRVDGDLSGTVTTPDVLIVGSSSTVRADITAGTIQIHGRVVGDVACSSRVEICPGGHLEGNVQTPRLIIEEGGNFQGQSRTTESEDDEAGGNPSRAQTQSEALPLVSRDSEEPLQPSENTSRWRILSRQLDSLRGSASSSGVEEADPVEVESRD